VTIAAFEVGVERPLMADCVEEVGCWSGSGHNAGRVIALEGYRSRLSGQDRRGGWDQLGKFPQVLGGGGENELVACAMARSHYRVVACGAVA